MLCSRNGTGGVGSGAVDGWEVVRGEEIEEGAKVTGRSIVKERWQKVE